MWEDLQGAVNFRYGADEPTEADIENGNGQHAGSVANLLARLQSGLYFIDARWPDAPRAYVEETSDEPAEGIDDCQLIGNCVFEFTSSFGRRGPVSVTLPPGYGHAKQQHVRYPVVYVLHGYGMTPEDLQAAIIFLANWMNGPTASQASRPGQAVLVYAHRRRRGQDTDDPAGPAERYLGTFYADSPSASGPQMDAWFLELIDHIDANYRTLGDSTVDWVE